MSRINDALKRAQRAQRKSPPAPGLTPLAPAPPGLGAPKLPLVASKPGNVIGWILPGVIGFFVVAAFLFIGMALVTRIVTTTSSGPKPAPAQPVNPAAIPAPIPAPMLVSNAPPPPPPPPPPPEPKLQGIVFATTRPWAIVDGRTVHVGDRLGEFRVKEISQRNVTLEKADGSQKKLGLDK